jgi:hypothetical protein
MLFSLENLHKPKKLKIPVAAVSRGCLKTRPELSEDGLQPVRVTSSGETAI